MKIIMKDCVYQNRVQLNSFIDMRAWGIWNKNMNSVFILICTYYREYPSKTIEFLFHSFSIEFNSMYSLYTYDIQKTNIKEWICGISLSTALRVFTYVCVWVFVCHFTHSKRIQYTNNRTWYSCEFYCYYYYYIIVNIFAYVHNMYNIKRKQGKH